MLDDWSDDAPERFPFWSRGELARIGLIASLAILPLAISAAEEPRHPQTQSQTRAANPVQPGQLRQVRIVDFDLAKLGMRAMADADDDAVR